MNIYVVMYYMDWEGYTYGYYNSLELAKEKALECLNFQITTNWFDCKDFNISESHEPEFSIYGRHKKMEGRYFESFVKELKVETE